MTPRVIASRSSATFLPEKSSGVREAAVDAAAAAVSPALRAPLAACCWRPRAFPPALAARLRAGLADDDALEPDFRAEDPDRALELLRELALDLRVPAGLRARELVLREPDPLLALRDLPVPDALRDDPPADDLLRGDPPPLPPVDSAMPYLLRSLAPHHGARRTISCPRRR
jgi:hypothetical protein